MEWISVKERLPDADHEVLIHTVDGDMHFASLWCDVGEEPIWANRNYELFECENITHWMELSAPPKEDTANA